MIDMALLSVLRRWHFREGMPIREITLRTGLSRNTVRKYLASGELEPRYKRPKSPSKLDDYELTLTSWLHREAKRPRKQRRISWRPGHGKNSPCYGHWRTGDSAAPLPRTVFIGDRAGQCARKREAGRQARTHRQSLNKHRFGHSR